MRLSNPGAHTAHTVAGDVTGDLRAPLAFAARPHGAGNCSNITATGGKPDRRSRAKQGAAVINDSGSWALRQPPNRERRQLPARADPITLVARAAKLRCGSGSELTQDEMLPARCRRGLDDCYACVPTCGLLHLRVQDPVSPQRVGIQAVPVTSPMNKGSSSGPL